VEHKRQGMIWLALTLLALSLSAPEVCATGGCGLRPLKPLTPLGCADLKPECHCDADGKNCVWAWICVEHDQR
jgi:hypothetical protein